MVEVVICGLGCWTLYDHVWVWTCVGWLRELMGCVVGLSDLCCLIVGEWGFLFLFELFVLRPGGLCLFWNRCVLLSFRFRFIPGVDAAWILFCGVCSVYYVLDLLNLDWYGCALCLDTYTFGFVGVNC